MSKKIAVLILMVISSIFIVIASVSISRSLKIKKNGTLVTATVTESRSNSKGQLKRVTVTFTTPAGEEASATASTRQRLSAGDKVQVWYDPSSPQKIDFGDTVKYNMRGVVIGGLLFLFGLYYFIRFSIKDNEIKKLLVSGRKISAELISAGRNERYNMGENNPWIIKCRWKDESTDKEYDFVSKDYTIDPAPYLINMSHIDVYIDPSDPQRYYMDTSFMPRGNNTIG
jgi:hypothetical protein